MVKVDKNGQPYRYLLVDQQKKGGRHFKVLCREFAANRESRKLGYWKRMDTVEEVRALQLELGIKDARVGFDVGDGNDVVENYNVVARYGWTG